MAILKRLPPHRKFLASVLLSAGLAAISMLGGLGIQAVRGKLVAFTPLLIALPAMNAIAGDYATLITAHLGDPDTYRPRMKKLVISLLISVPLSLAGITTMSLVVARSQGFQITAAAVRQYVSLLSFALIGILSFTALAIVLANRAVKHKQINSDDLLIPIANTVASVLVLISFALITINVTQ